MDFSLSTKAAASLTTDCLVIILDKGASTLPDNLPADSLQQLQTLIKNGDFSGKKDQTLLLQAPAGLAAKRLLLVGTGATGPLSISRFSQLMTGTYKALANTAASKATLLLDGLSVKDQDRLWLIRESTRLLADSTYRFDEYRSKPANDQKLKKLTLLTTASTKAEKQALQQGKAIADGMALARDLGNRPPNECYPETLTRVARDMANQYEKLSVKVISEKQAEKLGMGAFCSVARGSEREGQLIALEWKGAKGDPVALVGKGITFDTGGISLKPGASMDEMKFDMCGAASVLGTLKTVCELKLPIHLVVVVAAAENMPDGRASRPGDIVKTLSGQTVEILNTDAEGRLVLCDALTWVQQSYKPTTVIDVATLTGACVMALGSHAQAVYANDANLAQSLLEAGDDTGDRGWPMPLWDDYQEQLDSPFADMANIGGPKAGSVTAACFLSRFTKDVPWAHLDIAGTAWVSGGMKKGATGRPVPLLSRYLIGLAEA